MKLRFIITTFWTLPVFWFVEADLRAGFPCIVSIPGHAIVTDGLMVDSGV